MRWRRTIGAPLYGFLCHDLERLLLGRSAALTVSLKCISEYRYKRKKSSSTSLFPVLLLDAPSGSPKVVEGEEALELV